MLGNTFLTLREENIESQMRSGEVCIKILIHICACIHNIGKGLVVHIISGITCLVYATE